MNAAVHRLPVVERWHGADDTPLRSGSIHVMPSGQPMPLLGLGTWQIKSRPVDAIANALDLGFRMIDTAGDYHTHKPIGAALRARGAPRSSVYLVTKIEECDDAFAAARRQVAELGVEHVDLLLIHRPPPHGVGERLWDGLRRAKRAGLTRDIGVSNYSIHAIEELVYRTGEMPAVNQIEWSPFGHSPSMLDFCRDNSIVIQAWSPLTRGQRLNDDKLAAMAARYGKTPAQILMRWNLQSGVVPIAKSAEPRHQRELLNVFDFEIAGTDMLRLNAMNEYYSALGRLLYV